MKHCCLLIVFLAAILGCDKGMDPILAMADISGQWLNAPTNTYGERVTRLYEFGNSSFCYKARFDAGCNNPIVYNFGIGAKCA